MLRSAFQEKIPRVRTGIIYQFGLLFVAAFVLLLPVVYVGLIVLAGWGVYYHAVEHTGILGVVRSPPRRDLHAGRLCDADLLRRGSGLFHAQTAFRPHHPR